jgi:hypothetical protein
VLVVRVWCEADAEENVRGRVTACLDISDRREEMIAVRSAAEVKMFVENWLERFVGGARRAEG